MGVHVLVLAAFAPELAPLRGVLGDGLAATIGGQREVVAREVGIGLVAAAVGTASLLAELRPRAVVLVGSCGAFAASALSIGDVVVPRRLRLVDPAGLEDKTQFPGPMVIDMASDTPMSVSLAGDDSSSSSRCVATTLAITVDDRMAERIAEFAQADVEHLEAHGVAAACARHRVPFAAVLGVANSVGARGRSEWLAHHTKAEFAAGDWLARWLTASSTDADRTGGA